MIPLPHRARRMERGAGEQLSCSDRGQRRATLGSGSHLARDTAAAVAVQLLGRHPCGGPGRKCGTAQLAGGSSSRYPELEVWTTPAPKPLPQSPQEFTSFSNCRARRGVKCVKCAQPGGGLLFSWKGRHLGA